MNYVRKKTNPNHHGRNASNCHEKIDQRPECCYPAYPLTKEKRKEKKKGITWRSKGEKKDGRKEERKQVDIPGNEGKQG